MQIESTQLHAHKIRHLEALKSQIARCLEKELNLKAEERRERARQLGIESKIAEQREGAGRGHASRLGARGLRKS